MRNRFYSKMTNTQKEIADSFELHLFEKCINAINEASKANNAIVTLPFKNENNESVVHGCNIHMINIRDAYIYIVQEYIRYLDHVQEDHVRIYARNIGIKL